MIGLRLEDVMRATKSLFCEQNDEGVIRLKELQGEVPDVLLEGVLYQVRMLTSAGTPVAVRLYLDLGDLGAELWGREVHAMLRFSAQQHPALPQIHDGGSRQVEFGTEGKRLVGFVVADTYDDTLDHPDAARQLRQHKPVMLSQFTRLIDGLRLLHATGLSHRNVHPGAIEVTAPVADPSFGLRLARFEMSTLEANLLRRGLVPDDMVASEFRRLFLKQGRVALACAPPERLRSLFPREEFLLEPEFLTSDIYSLGVLAFTWFVDDLNPDLLASSFPTMPDESVGFDEPSHSRLLRWMRERLRDEPGLPHRLGDLIEKMLRDTPRTRPTTWEVLDELSRGGEDIAHALGEPLASGNYLVAVKPDEFRELLARGWIDDDPSTEQGLAAIVSVIQDDLRGGVLEHAEGGWAAVKGVSGADEKRANVVLRGKRGAYFAHMFEYRSAFEDTSGTLLEQVLFIRYVLFLESSFARRYEQPLIVRRLPTVNVVPWNSPYLKPRSARDRPSWRPLINSVQQQTPRSPAYREFAPALQFLLELQQVEVNARQYAFKLEGPSRGVVTLALDIDRDQQRYLKWPMLGLFCESEERRPSFGAFFGSLEDFGLSRMVSYGSDAGARSRDNTERPGIAEVVRSLDARRIEIRIGIEDPPVPAEGWIQPADNIPARIVIDRQWIAFRELLEHPSLLAQLAKPRSLVRPSNTWKISANGFEVPAKRQVTGGGRARMSETRSFAPLKGRTARRALRDLLDCWPFYALQGPPGTGKTTIVARAVRAALMQDPSLRILVSAQSHYALDNLAATIRECLPAEPELVLVRIAPRSGEHKIDHEIASLLPQNLGKRQAAAIRVGCRSRLKTNEDGQGLQSILSQLQARVQELTPEVIDRLWRGANVVFATCAAATEEQVGTAGDLGRYDWVIIEEAAKAWTTELTIPLVRGMRWALIGDHRQLPAYRQREVSQFLKACALSQDEELKLHSQRRESYEGVFNLFARLFEGTGAEGLTAEVDAETASEVFESRLIRPARTLNLQFRMAPAICELVSRAFYAGDLHTDSDDADPHGIAQFQNQSLVWVDTGAEVEHRCEPCWHNDGEVETIRALVALTKPIDGCHDDVERRRRLAILAPYREQVDHLERALTGPERACVHTIDSFQGREAEVVFVSLVRRRGGHLGAGAITRLGHLVSAQRANVMLSRARQLLVIVGDLAHFEQPSSEGPAFGDDGGFWPIVCSTVRDLGVVVASGELLSGNRGRRQ